MDNNIKGSRSPSFGKLLALKLIRALIIAALIWLPLNIAIQQFLRATAAQLSFDTNGKLYSMGAIYFCITDLELKTVDGEELEHEVSSIEDIAANMCTGAVDEDDYFDNRIFSQRSACAVYNVDTGDAVYTPDLNGFTDAEKMLLTYRTNSADTVYATCTQTRTFLDNVFENEGGKYTQTHVRYGYVNTEDGTHYAVRCIYTVNYSSALLAVRAVTGVVFAAAALIAALIASKRAKKRSDAVYSQSSDAAKAQIEVIRKQVDIPINVILGAAEGIRTAGDDRADNIIKNANLIKDAVFGTESDNAEGTADL